MTLAILIERIGQLRAMAPVIDAAMRRGHLVECWLPRESTAPGKADQAIREKAMPVFAGGAPVYRHWHSGEELMASLRRTSVAAVVSSHPPAFYGGAASRPRPWLVVQHANDLFHTETPSAILDCDGVALYSDWWVDYAAAVFAAERLVDSASDYAAALRAISLPVGQPAIDAAPMVDPEEVRARWKIPATQPVVVLLPFPQGVGKASFWPRGIFSEPSRLRRVANVIRHRRFEYWKAALAAEQDVDVVRAIRRMCDANGAFLLVKSRAKTPIPGYLASAADRCLYDEAFYPSTIIEALSIASVCISHYSFGVTEAAALGVPHVCVTFDVKGYVGEAKQPFFDTLFHDRPGGLFNYPGVSEALSAPDAIAQLPGRRLSEIQIDPVARRQYADTYLGSVDRQSAARLLASVERRHVEQVLS